MSLPSLCIRRPVFTIVLNVLVVLAGLAGIQSLSIRQLPRVDTPVLSVTTTYGGAEASLVETQVTTILEEQLGAVDGLKFMTSTTTDGVSRISMTFDLDNDIDAAANDVRAAIDQVADQLPDEADPPVTRKSDADAEPIVYIALSSDTMTDVAITDYLNRFLLNSFRAIDGVAQVTTFGDRDYEMRVALHPDRLTAQRMSVSEVQRGILEHNVDAPAGTIDVGPNEYALRTATALSEAVGFENLILRSDGLTHMRLEDVADVTLSGTDRTTAMRVNGKDSVGFGIVRAPTANPIDVAKAVRAQLDTVRRTLPAGLTAAIVFDSTVFIERSIEEVFQTIGEAFVLVLLIIVIFLGSLRSSVVPLVAIPVSIIGVLAFMAVLGFSINTLTLLALVMAIGLVVDDAIVVVENVHRHIEDGLPAPEAAHKGMAEVTFAVIATTISLAAVFAPVGMMPGTVGAFFKEFAFTLAGAVLISGLVALTLSPMMCARLLKPGQPNAFQRRVDAVLGGLTRVYGKALRAALKVRVVVVVLAFGVAAAAAWLYAGLRSELVPTEDQGYLLVVQATPTNSNLDHTLAITDEMTAVLKDAAPGLDSLMTVAGTPTKDRALGIVILQPWEDRPDVTVLDVQRAIHGPLSAIPGAMSFPIIPATFGSGASSQPVSLAIRTVGDYDQLGELMEVLQAKARALPELTGVQSDLQLDSLRFTVSVDREKAAVLGLTEADVGAGLSALFGGQKAGTFLLNGKKFDVRLRLEDSHRTGPQDIDSVFLRSTIKGTDGEPMMVSLDSIVTIGQVVAPAALGHYDQLRSATLSATPADGVALGTALDALVAAIEPELPANATFAYTGQSQEYVESRGGTAQVFGMAILVIFLVLAAQFESFRDPFAIMLTVPLAIAGALLTLTLAGQTNNIYAMIGMITLVGLITKHGILICEFANQLQDKGLDRMDAVTRAAEERLRPILMTTGAMILGLLPLAIATGPGAVSRQAIGLSVIGGLAGGTLLTLFVVPTMYSLIASRRTDGAGGAGTR